MGNRAIIIGNSDGIGLSLTRELLERGWSIHGLSRSSSPVEHDKCVHTVVDVRDRTFVDSLRRAISLDDAQLVIYSAGIGEAFRVSHLADDVATLDVNLMGLARTVECVLPNFVTRGKGTIVGLSSMADVITSREAPAYAASKAGMSRYLESVAQAVRHTGVHVVNVRLGFVDTKMAKAEIKLWMIRPEEAARRILSRVLQPSPPQRVNIPRRMAVLAAIAGAVIGRF